MSKERDIEKFDELYKQTYNLVLKHAIVKCIKYENINEIIQDTYTELYKKIRKLNKVDNINAYIIGIENNVIKRHFSKKKKYEEEYFSNSEEGLENIKDSTCIEDEFILKENIEEILNYVKTKDLETIKIFYLYYVFDMKIVDICKSLNMNESTVKSKLYRTVKELKNIFRKDVD